MHSCEKFLLEVSLILRRDILQLKAAIVKPSFVSLVRVNLTTEPQSMPNGQK